MCSSAMVPSDMAVSYAWEHADMECEGEYAEFGAYYKNPFAFMPDVDNKDTKIAKCGWGSYTGDIVLNILSVDVGTLCWTSCRYANLRGGGVKKCRFAEFLLPPACANR